MVFEKCVRARARVCVCWWVGVCDVRVCVYTPGSQRLLGRF